jgi:DNA protecting protein DprA
MDNELIYWIAISHLQNWTRERINTLVIDILKTKQMTLQDFFELDDEIIKENFALNEKEIVTLQEARTKLPNIAFQVENLFKENIKVIPLNSKLYPKTMKENLKVKYSPTIIYTKGDVNILQENSVAIVGSRDANEDALKFTDNISKKMAKEYKVVVSGFARGVDRQSLDSSIKYSGNSIIVLPQGILTFDSGFRRYKKEIEDAGVIVLSTFPVDAGWSTGLAMARNRYIYGLAKEIYVAQTNTSGGTWSGAVDGLRKGRDVYVYYPKHDPKSAAYELIKLGAKAVDFSGQLVDVQLPYRETQLKMF